MRRLLTNFALCLLAASATAQAQERKDAEQSGPYGTMVIRGATIIDGSGAPAFGPADIFVQGNRITRVLGSRCSPLFFFPRNRIGIQARGAGPRDRRQGDVRDSWADRFACTH